MGQVKIEIDVAGVAPYAVVIRESSESSGNRATSPTTISGNTNGVVINFVEVSDGLPHKYKVTLTDSSSPPMMFQAETSNLTCGVLPTPVTPTPEACTCVNLLLTPTPGGGVANTWSVTFKDCSGNTQTETGNGLTVPKYVCGCAGTVSQSGAVIVSTEGACGTPTTPISSCYTYQLTTNSNPQGSTDYSFTCCNSGKVITGTLGAGDSIQPCAVAGSVTAGAGVTIVMSSACNTDNISGCFETPTPVPSPVPTPAPTPTPTPTTPTPEYTPCGNCKQFAADPYGGSGGTWGLSYTDCATGNTISLSGSGSDNTFTFCACDGSINTFGTIRYGLAGFCGSPYTPPVAVDDSTGSRPINTAYNYDVTTNDTACQLPDTSTWELVAGSEVNCVVTVASNGVFTITPTAYGTHSFRYVIKCGNGIYSNEATVTGTTPTPTPITPIPTPTTPGTPVTPTQYCCVRGIINTDGPFRYTDCNARNPNGDLVVFAGGGEMDTEICFIPDRNLPPYWAELYPTLGVTEILSDCDCNVTPVAPTPVPSPTPSVQSCSSCVSYSVTDPDTPTWSVSYDDCNGIPATESGTAGQTKNFCGCSGSVLATSGEPNISILGSC